MSDQYPEFRPLVRRFEVIVSTNPQSFTDTLERRAAVLELQGYPFSIEFRTTAVSDPDGRLPAGRTVAQYSAFLDYLEAEESPTP